MTTHNLSQLFTHLPGEAMFEGACYVEPQRYGQPGQHAFMIGQVGYLQHETYRFCVQGFDLTVNRTAAGKGWIQEKCDHESAVEALAKFTSRGGLLP